jgi:hypothetical protein
MDYVDVLAKDLEKLKMEEVEIQLKYELVEQEIEKELESIRTLNISIILHYLKKRQLHAYYGNTTNNGLVRLGLIYQILGSGDRTVFNIIMYDRDGVHPSLHISKEYRFLSNENPIYDFKRYLNKRCEGLIPVNRSKSLKRIIKDHKF